MKLNQVCNKSLEAFCLYARAGFQTPMHLKSIIKHLEMVESGQIKRLIISCPPRHGKTLTSSIMFPAWFMGKNPKKDMILVSYNEMLASDLGRDIRNLMKTDEFKNVFSTRIADDSSSMKHFNTNLGGAVSAVGMGGTVTGRGGHVIIVDDLIKNDQEARSVIHRRNMLNFWHNTLYTRQQDKNAAFIIVNNRWHEDDLIGDILRNSTEKWVHLKFPAIDKAGHALWPDKFDLNYFQTIKDNNTLHMFETQFQQEPFTEEGEYIKASDIQWLDASKMPKFTDYENIVIGCDLTFKGGLENDFVVGQMWGKIGNNYYFIDMIRDQWDFTDTLFHVEHFMVENKCNNVLIEDAANGAAVTNVLSEKFAGIQLWKPEGDKISRVNAVSPLFRTKHVFVKKQIPQIDQFIHELTHFPNAAHDDTVDACTMSLINLKNQQKEFVVSLGQSVY